LAPPSPDQQHHISLIGRTPTAGAEISQRDETFHIVPQPRERRKMNNDIPIGTRVENHRGEVGTVVTPDTGWLPPKSTAVVYDGETTVWFTPTEKLRPIAQPNISVDNPILHKLE
jgi:hypothetical protein